MEVKIKKLVKDVAKIVPFGTVINRNEFIEVTAKIILKRFYDDIKPGERAEHPDFGDAYWENIGYNQAIEDMEEKAKQYFN